MSQELIENNDLLRRMHRLCATKESRGVLTDHIRAGGFVYCSTGFLAVRAPADLWPALTEDTVNAPNFENVWVGIEAVDRWVQADLSLVEISPLPPCTFCGGAGAIECPTCSHEKDCEDCDGSGTDDPYRHRIPVTLGANVTSARYLQLILDAFPEAVFCANSTEGGGIPWKASRVTGVVMPIRPNTDDPQPVSVTAALPSAPQLKGGGV